MLLWLIVYHELVGALASIVGILIVSCSVCMFLVIHIYIYTYIYIWYCMCWYGMGIFVLLLFCVMSSSSSCSLCSVVVISFYVMFSMCLADSLMLCVGSILFYVVSILVYWESDSVFDVLCHACLSVSLCMTLVFCWVLAGAVVAANWLCLRCAFATPQLKRPSSSHLRLRCSLPWCFLTLCLFAMTLLTCYILICKLLGHLFCTRLFVELCWLCSPELLFLCLLLSPFSCWLTAIVFFLSLLFRTCKPFAMEYCSS
jgi:hypothetical protein